MLWHDCKIVGGVVCCIVAEMIDLHLVILHPFLSGKQGTQNVIQINLSRIKKGYNASEGNNNTSANTGIQPQCCLCLATLRLEVPPAQDFACG